MNTSATPVLRRLNGRLQACDPCRSRKVSCDHTQPVCLRCRKRKQDRYCVYTVSSTTVEATRPASISAPSSSPATQLNQQDVSAPITGPSLLSPNSDTSAIVNSPTNTRGSTSRTVGYLGYTSYCTVIEETLSILNGQPDVPQSPCTEDCPIHISSKTLAIGVTILRHIPYPEDSQRFFRKERTIYDGWLRLFAKRVLGTLYVEWGKYLGHDRSPVKLEEMARKICVNTAKPIVNKTDADATIAQFSGPNLRWEIIGVLFNYWDLMDSHKELPLPDGRAPPGHHTPTTYEALMLCLEIAQEFSDGNPFTVYLGFRRTVFESVISGDASRQAWRYLADTVASLTFLGMHAEPNGDFYQPTFYSEISRRVMLPVFTIDKVQLAFTGRPPLLFRKFITTPMPLDIKDEYLFLDQESLIEKSRTTVDDKGWNTEGGFYSSTINRARYMLAQIREQIAEIALGNECHATVADLRQIKERQIAAEAEFPHIMLWRQEEITDYSIPSHILFTRLLLKLDGLQNDFFLYRLLLRKGEPDEGNLLLTSYELVSLVLNLFTHMDRFSEMRPDFEWLLMGYGASPGGILCKCLLKARSSQIHASEPAITRSSIIQKLSLLVGFLDWVRPSAPNAELCKDCKSVIQRVLDQALNSTPGEAPSFWEGMDVDFSTQLDFNFDLMDTFDWLRSDYENSQHA